MGRGGEQDRTWEGQDVAWGAKQGGVEAGWGGERGKGLVRIIACAK